MAALPIVVSAISSVAPLIPDIVKWVEQLFPAKGSGDQKFPAAVATTASKLPPTTQVTPDVIAEIGKAVQVTVDAMKASGELPPSSKPAAPQTGLAANPGGPVPVNPPAPDAPAVGSVQVLPAKMVVGVSVAVGYTGTVSLVWKNGVVTLAQVS